MKIGVLLLSGALLTGLIFLLDNLTLNIIHALAWKINVFLLFIAIITSRLALKLINKGNAAYSLLAIIVFRMLFSLSFVAVLVVKGLDNKILFGINFFILYLVYLAFDICCLITNLHANLKRSGDKHEIS